MPWVNENGRALSCPHPSASKRVFPMTATLSPSNLSLSSTFPSSQFTVSSSVRFQARARQLTLSASSCPHPSSSSLPHPAACACQPSPCPPPPAPSITHNHLDPVHLLVPALLHTSSSESPSSSSESSAANSLSSFLGDLLLFPLFHLLSTAPLALAPLLLLPHFTSSAASASAAAAAAASAALSACLPAGRCLLAYLAAPHRDKRSVSSPRSAVCADSCAVAGGVLRTSGPPGRAAFAGPGCRGSRRSGRARGDRGSRRAGAGRIFRWARFPVRASVAAAGPAASGFKQRNLQRQSLFRVSAESMAGAGRQLVPRRARRDDGRRRGARGASATGLAGGRDID